MFQAHGIGAATGDQAALMHDQQVVAGLHFVQQVSGPEHADALLAAQLPDVQAQGEAAGRIEADAGFVEQQQARFMEQGAGDFHPASMTAVEVAHPLVAPLGQVLAGQFGVDANGALASRKAVQRQVITQVLFNAQVQVQGALLEHYAQLAQGRSWRLLQGVAANADVAVL